jgi:heme oxygenase (biliverdin-producing, ferredoxin)
MKNHQPVSHLPESLNSEPLRLADLLRDRTRSLHVAAERSGILRELLRGGGTRAGYVLLLRNLLPAYQQLERGLERHADTPVVGLLAKPFLYRAAAIEADLKELSGPRWCELVFLPEGENYAACVAAAGEGDGIRLIAHAYLRYLGDLNGGQILKRLLSRSLGLENKALSFYDFPEVADIAECKNEFRADLDRCADAIGDAFPVIEEAENAFRLNIALSEAVLDAAAANG